MMRRDARAQADATNKLADAIRDCLNAGMSVGDFLEHARACWEAALKDDMKAANEVFQQQQKRYGY